MAEWKAKRPVPVLAGHGASVVLGGAEHPEANTPDLDVEAWAARIRRDADAFLARRQPARRPHRGGSR